MNGGKGRVNVQRKGGGFRVQDIFSDKEGGGFVRGEGGSRPEIQCDAKEKSAGADGQVKVKSVRREEKDAYYDGSTRGKRNARTGNGGGHLV